MQQYLKMFMDTLDFPEEAKRAFLDTDVLLKREPAVNKQMQAIVERFNSEPKQCEIKSILDELTRLSNQVNIPSETIHLLFFMVCSKALLQKYKAANLPDEVFWNSMLDLRYKLYECHTVHGVWGTFVASWFPAFYTLERFGLGRLQFQYGEFSEDSFAKQGYTVKKGDPVFNIHIPSAGPLTRESRMDSYRKAYRFFQNNQNGRPLILACRSWLLYPKNELFFPKGSNILDFMRDFTVVNVEEEDTFTDAWRVFGKDYNGEWDKLPADTSLQKAYIRWLKDGNKTGFGYGVLFFDGEHIQ